MLLSKKKFHPSGFEHSCTLPLHYFSCDNVPCLCLCMHVYMYCNIKYIIILAQKHFTVYQLWIKCSSKRSSNWYSLRKVIVLNKIENIGLLYLANKTINHCIYSTSWFHVPINIMYTETHDWNIHISIAISFHGTDKTSLTKYTCQSNAVINTFWAVLHWQVIHNQIKHIGKIFPPKGWHSALLNTCTGVNAKITELTAPCPYGQAHLAWY